MSVPADKLVNGFEVDMKGTIGLLGLLACAAFAIVGSAACDENDERENQAAVAKALTSATILLEEGLRASEPQGLPISAKFEVEHGELQLSVYTMKGDTFSETIVNPMTGDVAKTEAITSGEDLAAAEPQRVAMGKAKRSLREATQRAVDGNAGWRAVSVSAARWAIVMGPPVARITLLQGETFKTVTEPLD